MTLHCQHCGEPIGYFVVESDDPEVGWCSEYHYEVETEGNMMVERRTFDE